MKKDGIVEAENMLLFTEYISRFGKVDKPVATGN